ncbi:hypothetical protein F4803DRAFT_550045 [Xylaria telfairii]|nr:hypothetical protein F4803DRAFT_550045 [Xylaria telfairii]
MAPTRTEISAAHKADDWLDIGVSSYRNLRGTRINVRRKVLAISLFTGSLPLHLLWNSVFFSAVPIGSYQVSLVTRDFQFDPRPWDATFISDSQYWITRGANHTGARDSDSLQQMARESRLELLDKPACIKRYLETNIRHKSVLVVAANVSMSDRLSWIPSNVDSSLLYRFKSIPTAPSWVWETIWLCSAFWAPTFPSGPKEHRITTVIEFPETRSLVEGWWCSKEYLLSIADTWTMQFIEIDKDQQIRKTLSAKVDYCLSAGVEQDLDGCAIRYSSVLLLAVTGVNGYVLICIYFTWKSHRVRVKEVAQGRWEEQQLTTLDEAVSSFLQHEDRYTATATIVEISDYNDSTEFSTLGTMTNNSRPAVHRLRSKLRLYRGAGKLPWYTTAFLFIVATIALIILLVKALVALTEYDLPTDLGSLWHMGIGEAHGYTIALTQAIKSLGSNAFYGTLILANVPQVVLGLLWWLANSLLTKLLLAQRWARFIVKRSGLRMSSPEGQQRSSQVLSLPYRYSIPLIIASAVLHWLLSQAIFVVQTRGFIYDLASQSKDQFVRNDALDGSVIGYSTIAFIFALAIVLGISMSIALLAMKPLPSRALQPSEGAAEAEQGSLVTRMPLALSCSAAISAACHPGLGSQDIHLDLVQWGKMESGKWSITNETPLRYSIDA